MTKLQMMQTNPGMMMKDPEMMEVLQALLGGQLGAMGVCLHMCIYIHLCIRTHMCACIQMCYIHTNTYNHVYTHMHTEIFEYLHKYTPPLG